MCFKGIIVGILIVLFNFADGIITYFIIDESIHELNPLIRFGMEEIGWWVLLPKFVLGMVVGVFICKYWDKFKVARVGGLVSLFVYSFIMIYHVLNMFVIQRG